MQHAVGRFLRRKRNKLPQLTTIIYFAHKERSLHTQKRLLSKTFGAKTRVRSERDRVLELFKAERSLNSLPVR